MPVKESFTGENLYEAVSENAEAGVLEKSFEDNDVITEENQSAELVSTTESSASPID